MMARFYRLCTGVIINVDLITCIAWATDKYQAAYLSGHGREFLLDPDDAAALEQMALGGEDDKHTTWKDRRRGEKMPSLKPASMQSLYELGANQWNLWWREYGKLNGFDEGQLPLMPEPPKDGDDGNPPNT